GSFRLVIAVDEITEELKLIVNYLNRQTDPNFHFLALELRRAEDEGVEVLTPETYGEEIVDDKGRPVDEATVKRAIRNGTDDPEAAERVISLYEWMRDYPHGRLSWGTSTKWPSVTAYLGEGEGRTVSISFFGEGVAVNFDYLRDRRHPD